MASSASACAGGGAQQQATIGLIVVTPACQGRRIGHRLMSALLEGLEGCSVLLHATTDGRGLYERLGFTRIGEVRQHQGTAQPSPPIALEPGQRLRPATKADAAALRALDAAARGMHRDALIDELLRDAQATVVLDDDGSRAWIRDVAPIRPRPCDRSGSRARTPKAPKR